MTNNLPRIAVLVAAYNAENTIRKTIDCLNADKEPHDIIVVDDGSKTPIKSVIRPQENLHIITLDKNQGQAMARNAGLAYILDKGYEFVCIHDADDTASPERLRIFREFLDANKEYGVVGSWVRYLDEQGKTIYFLKLPVDNDEINTGLYYNNCLFWGMYRTDALRAVGIYEKCMSEDYDLTCRVAKRYKVKNIPQYLCDYTVSMTGISQSKTTRQMLSLLKLQLKHFNFFRADAYIGVFKTLLRLTLSSVRRGRKETQSASNGKTAPVFVWRPFRGQVYEGEKEI